MCFKTKEWDTVKEDAFDNKYYKQLQCDLIISGQIVWIWRENIPQFNLNEVCF